MPSLDEFCRDRVPAGRRSVVDRLPEDVRDQLVAAFRAGSHSVREMVRWLHGDDELPDVARRVTRPMLHKWFERQGLRYGEANEQP